jgi:hypothetical protein
VELLKDILSRYLESSGLNRHVQYAELKTAWAAALGPTVTHTLLESVRKNVALFVVDNAALLAELNNFRKLELLAHLQSEVHGIFIRDLRFRLGKIEK